MKISKLIKVSVENGTLVFSPKGKDTSMCVIGCSCTLSKKSGSYILDKTPTVVRPQNGVNVTVIGFKIDFKLNGDICTTHAFIGIYLKNEKYSAHLEDHYTFTGGSISAGDGFSVVITLDDGRKFACRAEFEKNKDAPEGFHLVDNPDFLFQFAAGIIDLPDLEFHAKVYKNKLDAENAEIESLKKRILSLETELGGNALTISKMSQELRAEKNATFLSEKTCNELQVSNQRLQDALSEANRKLDDDLKFRELLTDDVILLKHSMNGIRKRLNRSWLLRFFPWCTVRDCADITRKFFETKPSYLED